MVTDYHGQSLTEGAHVTAWRDGNPYTGQVTRISPRDPGSGYHRVNVTRDSDGTQTETFSDAVIVTSSGTGDSR